MIENTRRAWARWRTRLHATVADERGDVPGWVLVTLMTAGLTALTPCGRFPALPAT